MSEESKEIMFRAVPVDERKPEWAHIQVVLLDGRLPMMAQWRPPGEWWSMGMANAHRIEEKKKCVTHWLERMK